MLPFLIRLDLLFIFYSLGDEYSQLSIITSAARQQNVLLNSLQIIHIFSNVEYIFLLLQIKKKEVSNF